MEVLISIFLMASDVEKIFICLLDVLSLEKSLLRCFARFLLGVPVFLLLSCMSSLRVILNPGIIRYMMCKYFLLFCRLSFHFLDCVF